MILLDDVLCNGTEDTLIDCPRKDNTPVFQSDCNHSEDAGVLCECKDVNKL